MAALLQELAADAPEGELIIAAPAVGLFRGHLPEGAGVVPGQEIGTLQILARVVHLLAPEGAQGTVTRSPLGNGLHPVDYGAGLLVLGAAAQGAARTTSRTGESGIDLKAGQFEVRSPTEGVFYRRADPASPPFVEVGSVVESGHALGMVEVMKCFNQVRYGGPGLPHRARVAAILAGDASEISHDQPLFVMEPAE
jgi:acetyl-CoA carboxylase biotin carboxyl carrier protein